MATKDSTIIPICDVKQGEYIVVSISQKSHVHRTEITADEKRPKNTDAHFVNLAIILIDLYKYRYSPIQLSAHRTHIRRMYIRVPHKKKKKVQVFVLKEPQDENVHNSRYASSQ